MLGLIGFVGVTPAGANPVTNFTTVCNTDVAYAGLGGMRGTAGSGTITLSGVSGTVTRAYLSGTARPTAATRTPTRR